MKKHIILMAMALTACCSSLVSCSDDDLDPESVITIDKNKQVTQFDRWLKQNYVDPYNIEVKYRYEDKETDMDYYEVPASYDNSVIMAHLLKYLCIDAYSEAAGVDFTRTYFPKLIVFSGEFLYDSNGTMKLGTSEGGKKITFTGVNRIKFYQTMPDALNYYYFKTLHHEFTHILNQTIPIPTEYRLITGTAYVGDQWKNYDETGSWSPTYTYLKRGFITAYAMKEYREDFAEMASSYVISDSATWQSNFELAGDEGAALLKQKMDIIINYYKENFNIDLDELREVILRREAELAAGKVELEDLSVNE